MRPRRVAAILMTTAVAGLLAIAPLARASDVLVDRPGSHALGDATLTVAAAGDLVDLRVVEADGRESLGFDLRAPGSRWLVLGSPSGEVWASGGADVFGWRREADGLYRAIEIIDAGGRPTRRLPDAFFDRLPAAVKANWAEAQATARPGPAPAGPFRVTPTRPIDEIRAEAIQARPPAEEGEFLESDLVDLETLDPRVKLDIRYAGDDNFLGVPVYTSARAFLQRPAAEALKRAQAKLGERGFGLLIHDGYRPWYVTKVFREATPPKYHGFVADPARGSRHNRGCAVDLSLYDLETGKPVDMPTGYDDFSRCAFSDYPGVTRAQAANRAALREALEAEGFLHIPNEWWHFDYKDWKRYPIQNAAFEDL
ncbi:M15 family metallopeptidase [Paludisphaera sp.]|uniref:M15 family metallopeptidase n=1 Tax=Paludisphaera sp. TaxID=2017432 RepID=UPI00301E00A3